MPENILSCCIIEIFFHMQLMGFSFVRERKATKLIPVKCTDSHHLYTAKCQENEATFGDMTLVYNLCFGFDKWSYVGKVS